MINHLYEYDLIVLYPAVILLIAGTMLFGLWLGSRSRGDPNAGADLSTMTSAALGLLALLLAFSFSLALSRYDARRAQVLQEANAIGSTANFALMLPEPDQKPILALLRDYTEIRIGLGVPYDPAKLQRDIARSVELQSKLWQLGVSATAASPQSLPVYRFVGSLNEMNNIHESRLTALRYHVPGEVMVMLVGVAMMAMGFAGFQSGRAGVRRPAAALIMSLAVGVVIALTIDLDQPARGLIEVPVQPLLDALPPSS